LRVFEDELREAGFVSRHYALAEPLDLFFIDVDAGDVNAEFCEACTGHESNITGTDYSDMHLTTFWALDLGLGALYFVLCYVNQEPSTKTKVQRPKTQVQRPKPPTVKTLRVTRKPA